MKTAIMVTRGAVSITGLTQIVMGVLFWTGHAMALVPAHMVIGFVFVLGLWTLAVLAARAGAPRGLVAFALVWGLVVPAFGFAQLQLLPGPLHWIIRVVHLLIGMVAMGLADALFKRSRASTGAVPSRTPRPAF